MTKEYPLLRDFFSGKTVALTGGTGFIGQGVIEKLLRCCPDVSKIILLIRNKKDKTPEERLKELTQLPVFSLLREQQPDFARKLHFMSCDLEAKDLGLSEESVRILRQECNVFIHSAATVRFNEHLRLAFEINVQCTRRLLKVFKRDRNSLQAFIHVSTAYSQTDRTEVEEKLYPCSIDYKDLESSLRWMTDDMITQLTPEMLGKRPNTYTLTKAMAEDAIAREGNHLPICIVRPSMIIPAFKEPIPGWCTNMYGPTAFLVAYSMGVVRALIADTNTVADLIPIDFVVNGVLAAAMKTACDSAERRSSLGYHSDSGGSFSDGCPAYSDNSTSSSDEDSVNLPPPKISPLENHQIPIYLINSSTVNPTTLGDQAEYAFHYYDIFPAKAIRTPYLYITENRFLYSAVSFTLQTIPAYAIDACRTVIGKRRKMIDINTRIRKSVDVIEFFFTNSFKFGIEKQQELFKSLQPEDQKTYSLDVSVIDWRKYGETYARGCNRFLLKVDEEKYDENKKNLQRLKLLDKCMYSVSALGVAGVAFASGLTDSLWDLTGVVSENLGISVIG